MKMLFLLFLISLSFNSFSDERIRIYEKENGAHVYKGYLTPFNKTYRIYDEKGRYKGKIEIRDSILDKNSVEINLRDSF